MSHVLGPLHVEQARFPRVSGDEPGVTQRFAPSMPFSPRERG